LGVVLERAGKLSDTPQLGGVLRRPACLCDTMAFRVDRAEEGSFPWTALPAGTLTFVLGDVAGSTRLWEQQPRDMPAAFGRLDELVGTLVAASGGTRPVEQGEGDNFVAAFAQARDAVDFAAALARTFDEEPWPGGL